MDKRVVAVGLALFGVTGAMLWIPWATKNRTVIASTPVPAALFGITPVKLGPGREACLLQVTFTPQSQVGEIGVSTAGRAGPPLRISASAPDYRTRARIPGGYRTTPALRFALGAPMHPALGKLCIRNAGRDPVSLNSTIESRSMGRPVLELDGVKQEPDPHLAFYARRRASFAARIGPIFRHAAIFTPVVPASWPLLVLAVIALVGIPLGALCAFAIAVGRDKDRNV